MENSTPLFKGATRPACFMGIPIKPFVCTVGFILILSFWIYPPIMVALIPILFLEYRITKDDDQRFLQLFLAFQTNILGTGNKFYWKGVKSFSPVSYKKQNIKGKK